MNSVPAWMWADSGVVAGLGLCLCLYALFADRARGRRRCPRCWYDMAGAPTLMCPECGRVAGSVRELARTRRRWWAAALGLALIAPASGLGAVRYGRTAWYALLPRWKLIEEHRWGEARARVHQMRDPREPGQRGLITLRGRTVADIQDMHVYLGGGDGTGQRTFGLMEDVTGDGAPDLVVETYSGGAHCCSTVHIISMGEDARELAVIETQSEGLRFEPGDQPGRCMLVTADPTFEYWMTAYVSSARPGLVLRFRGEQLDIDSARMGKPVPETAKLQAAKSWILARALPGSGPDPKLWSTVLDLLYSGHEAEGWAFFEEAWPPVLPGKDEFKKELVAQLGKSPWWPKVRASMATALAPGERP